MLGINREKDIALLIALSAVTICTVILCSAVSVSAQEGDSKGGDTGGGWGGGGYCDNGGGWAAAASDKSGAVDSSGWGWGGEGGGGSDGGGGGSACRCGETIECSGGGETGMYCWNVCWPCPPTPPPTSSNSNPPPTVTVSANPREILRGNSSLITWSSTNATSCTGSASPADSTFSTGNSIGSSDPVTPTVATTYTVQCTGRGGTVSGNDTVLVRSPRCSDGIDNDGDGVKDTDDPGCRTNPSDSSTYNSRDDDEGASSSLISVNIEATPKLIEQGDATFLNWTSMNAVSCSVTGTNNGGSWTGLSNTGQQTNALNQTTIFTLTCIDVDGSPKTDSVIVRINPRVIEE